jgi:hypothetical protein
MRERPILFSAAMVRAILAGRKTQTRRIVKGVDGAYSPIPAGHRLLNYAGEEEIARCPYGKPGDRLWCKETWHYVNHQHGPRGLEVCIGYPADGDDLPNRPSIPVGEEWADRADAWPYRPRRHPSIHMPRWASRITLEITGVRVERLQAISEADAKAEGVEPPEAEREDHDWSICPTCGGTGLHGSLGDNLGYREVDCTDCDTHAKRYRHLWNAINGPGSWDANPWVWVVEFRRLSEEKAVA